MSLSRRYYRYYCEVAKVFGFTVLVYWCVGVLVYWCIAALVILVMLTVLIVLSVICACRIDIGTVLRTLDLFIGCMLNSLY